MRVWTTAATTMNRIRLAIIVFIWISQNSSDQRGIKWNVKAVRVRYSKSSRPPMEDPLRTGDLPGGTNPELFCFYQQWLVVVHLHDEHGCRTRFLKSIRKGHPPHHHTPYRSTITRTYRAGERVIQDTEWNSMGLLFSNIFLQLFLAFSE